MDFMSASISNNIFIQRNNDEFNDNFSFPIKFLNSKQQKKKILMNEEYLLDSSLKNIANEYINLFTTTDSRLDLSFPGKHFNNLFDKKLLSSIIDKTAETKENNKNSNSSRRLIDILNTFSSNKNSSIDKYLHDQGQIYLLKEIGSVLSSSYETKQLLMLSSNSNIITLLSYLLWENYINSKSSNVLYCNSPFNFITFKPYLECLLKGIPNELFYFDHNELTFKINSSKNLLRFTGISELLSSNYLNKMMLFGNKLYLIQECANYLITQYSHESNSLVDFYYGINKILIRIFHDLTQIMSISNGFISLIRNIQNIEEIVGRMFSLLKINHLKEQYVNLNILEN